jgi:hypothetical protein
MSEEEIHFASSYKQVTPESVSGYFADLSPYTFSFYHYPGSGAVILIWTRHTSGSTKVTNYMTRVRRDLVLIAARQGIEAVHKVIPSAYAPILRDITNLTHCSSESLRRMILPLNV